MELQLGGYGVGYRGMCRFRCPGQLQHPEVSGKFHKSCRICAYKEAGQQLNLSAWRAQRRRQTRSCSIGAHITYAWIVFLNVYIWICIYICVTCIFRCMDLYGLRRKNKTLTSLAREFDTRQLHGRGQAPFSCSQSCRASTMRLSAARIAAVRDVWECGTAKKGMGYLRLEMRYITVYPN